MSVRVRIPTPLRSLTAGAAEVTAEAKSIRDLIETLERRYPGMHDRLCDEEGKIRRFVNIFVNADDIRFQKDIETPVRDGDEVSIIPAIAGGGGPRA